MRLPDESTFDTNVEGQLKNPSGAFMNLEDRFENAFSIVDLLLIGNARQNCCS